MQASAPVKPWVLLTAAGLLAVQVLARHAGVLEPESWLVAHLALGWSCLALLLRCGDPAAWQKGLTRRSAWVIAGTAAALCGFWYLGRIDAWERWWQAHVAETGWLRPVWAFAYFSIAAAVFRLGVPWLLAGKLGLSTRDLGWRRGQGGRRTWPVYAALYLAVVPAVWVASGTAAFQAKYPLARALLDANQTLAVGEFVAYQALYVLVFVSGECFWRGWIAFGLYRDWGAYAVPWMLVPYVCAHFGKPLAETLGAIAAGAVLGALALRHGSVWLGVALHYAVALTMDVSAVWRAGIGWRW
ncbi:MAG: CPBP family intramembrane metalloprotease [Deltaproteobacteria bacterium]|nr:CPBP family intramembrane metalloprotease [Deltaproteobacteria bacterium]